MTLLENLQWRYAAKAYDPEKKVAKDNIDKIIEAARLAPTSSGLQPFRLMVVTDKALRTRMAAGSLNPDCMTECSHVLVFAAWDRYTVERIDRVYDRMTDERGLPRGRFGRYTDQLKASYTNQSVQENFAHTSRQSYIALGLALAQAAELRIDATPAEGFDSDVIDEVLSLRERGLRSVSLMYVGYADSARDWLAPMKKVRVPKEEFVFEYE